MENLEPNTILKDKNSILLYIKNYYQKLYMKEDFDEEYQDKFLGLITKVLSEEEQKLLIEEVNQNEIFNAIKDMSLNRAPGIDGIPVEFYIQYWSIIKSEITDIIKNIIKGTLLNEKQRKAIITLIPKMGDLSLLKTWRPVSLICCDTKIVAKILAKRIAPLLYSLLSENQYCILGKSIIECNNKIRDIMYYSGTNNINGAIINIDWEKAFDRVNWQFLIKIMHKMKFPIFIIKWIMILYTNIESVCLVNGHFSDVFKVYRGIRQGCPLSMLMFVIFQNPLYLAIENTNRIKRIEVFGNNTKEIGYADDTNVIVIDDEGIVEVFKIIDCFVKATNSKVNINKTKIYGFGNWKGRMIWPIQNLKVEEECFKTLGIHFSCDYDIALKTMWKYIYDKIKIRVSIMRNRSFTLYQKAILVNSLISSKIWYASHVYPFPMKYATLINKEIFQFIWGSGSNPIRREVLYNKKENGGLGLLNIYQKSKSIFVSTMIKSFLTSNEEDLIRFYVSTKIGYLFNIKNKPRIVSKVNTPYFEFAIDTIKKCKNNKKFPKINSKDIYEILVTKVIPSIVSKYDFNWPNIWKHLNFKYINVNDRNVMFKFIYEILPTNKRLHQITIGESLLCEECEMEDTNSHRFYHCYKVQDCLKWLKRVIYYICGIKVNSLLKILYLDIPKIEKRNMNSMCIIITCYISCIWRSRENLNHIKKFVKAKMIRDQRFHMSILGKEQEGYFLIIIAY